MGKWVNIDNVLYDCYYYCYYYYYHRYFILLLFFFNLFLKMVTVSLFSVDFIGPGCDLIELEPIQVRIGADDCYYLDFRLFISLRVTNQLGPISLLLSLIWYDFCFIVSSIEFVLVAGHCPDCCELDSTDQRIGLRIETRPVQINSIGEKFSASPHLPPSSFLSDDGNRRK